uniref:UDP-galactose transporter n=1 Tax=Talaromyces marneffei PM1 TaxID=1077442 RepID=A0A093V2J1_TALMA
MGVKQTASKSRSAYIRNLSLLLLTIQYASTVVLIHYSRVMPTVAGKRYVTSTAVFLTEAIKLAISLTMALYEISKRVPPSMPATSLFSTLSNTIFSGDSWKLALPACLYTLSNSLQYVALSNLDPATYQITYQVKLLFAAVFGLVVLQRYIPARNWGLLLFLAAGVVLLHAPGHESDRLVARDESVHFPRSLEEWKQKKGYSPMKVMKRSASYEGIEEDMLLEHPTLDGRVGLIATLCACVASALAAVSFEKVIRDSAAKTSLWVRNVQLALQSVVPAFFVGVIFLDGEVIAKQGFFAGYSWIVWVIIFIQAIGGIGAGYAIAYTDKTAKTIATGFSLVVAILTSLSVFDLDMSVNFSIGAAIVLIASFLYGSSTPSTSPLVRMRPPPIRIESYDAAEDRRPGVSPPNDFSIKLPTTPSLSAGLSTSRPASPSHSRVKSNQSGSGYFLEPDA